MCAIDDAGSVDRLPPGEISLRRSTPADAGLILGWRDEPSTGRWMPNRRRSPAEMEERLKERTAPAVDPALSGTVQWMVEAGGEPVGWVRFTVTDRENGVGEVGYTIGERHRGRGYATAAVRKVLTVAFAATGADVERVEAVAAVGNAASRRVLERNGFHFEGVARGLLVIGGERVDHARYGVLRGEWEETSGTSVDHARTPGAGGPNRGPSHPAGTDRTE